MKTYEQRLEEIFSVADIDKQLRLAKQAVMQLRNKSKSDRLTLANKLAINEEIKLGEAILRRLRQNSFDIEDRLLAEAGNNA